MVAYEARHKAQTIENGIHSSISFEYINAAARIAAGPFDDFDKYKLAVQTDDNSVWLLLDTTSKTWVQITSGGSLISGDLDLDGYNIINAGFINNVDIEQHSSRHQLGGLDEINVNGLSGVLNDSQNINIKKNSVSISTHPSINFIEGTNVYLTITNNTSTNTTDIRISASGGSGGGGGGSLAEVLALGNSTDGYDIIVTTGSSITGGGSVIDIIDGLNLNNYSITNVYSIDGYSLYIEFSKLDQHILNTNNPHATSIANIGSGTLTQLNSAISDANIVPDTRTITAGAGLTGGGDLSLNRTINVVAADSTITVNVDSIQVGVITDTNHGTRSGGTLHSEATTSVAGFMSAADKTKLDSLNDGYGDVVGPSSSTNNAVARFDSTTGKIIKNSVVTIDDSGNISTPGTVDGYDLTTTFQNIETRLNSAKKVAVLEYILNEEVINTNVYFFSWRGAGTDIEINKRSGTDNGISTGCSPILAPFNSVITKAICVLGGAGVQSGSVSFPVSFQISLDEQLFFSKTNISTLIWSISNTYTIGNYITENTGYKGIIYPNINITEGQLLSLEFISGNSSSIVGQMKNAVVTLVLEEI